MGKIVFNFQVSKLIVKCLVKNNKNILFSSHMTKSDIPDILNNLQPVTTIQSVQNSSGPLEEETVFNN